MQKSDSKESIFVRMFEILIRFTLKFRVLVLIAVVIATMFFTKAMMSLGIDANIFGFASGTPANEFVETPGSPPEGEPVFYELPDEIKNIELPSYSYQERSAEEKLVAYLSDIGEKREHASYPDGFVIIFTSDDLYTVDCLNQIQEVMTQLEMLDWVGPCFSPFDFVTVEKRGTRLALTPMSPVQEGETWTDEDASVFKNRLLSDKMAENYLYGGDGQTIMIYYRTLNYNQEQQDLMTAIVDPLRDYGRVALNGGSTITNRVTDYIFQDLALLLSLCFVIILIVYYLSFRSLRAVVVPSSLSIIAIVWTLGTMSLMGYKMSIVGVLVPCLVLTLGSSYSVHMISEYYSIHRLKIVDQTVSCYARISKTIISACLTTIVGFLSMLVCRTNMFREFAISVSIGVVYCAILAIFYLPSVLSILPTPKEKAVRKAGGGIMEKFINLVIHVVTKFWVVVLVVLAVIVILYAAVGDKVTFNANYMDYFPQDDPLVEDSIYFAQTMGGTDPYYFTINAPNGEEGFFLKSENLAKVHEFEMTVMEACPDIVQSMSFSQYVSFLNYVYSGEEGIPENNGLLNFLNRTLMQIKNQIGSDIIGTLINEDGSQVTLAMRNYDAFEQNLQTTASARRIENTLDYYRCLLPEGTTSQITCLASRMLKASDMMVEDQNKANIISYVGIVIVATITLASISKGLASIISVIVGIMLSYIFMYFAGIPLDIVTIGFSSVTIGAGIDDDLHFLLRYKHNRKLKPKAPMKDLIASTLHETGRPIILTSLSVDAGMLVLMAASFIPIKYFGLFMCFSLTVAMLATIFILPSVMMLFDKLREVISRNAERGDNKNRGELQRVNSAR